MKLVYRTLILHGTTGVREAPKILKIYARKLKSHATSSNSTSFSSHQKESRLCLSALLLQWCNLKADAVKKSMFTHVHIM